MKSELTSDWGLTGGEQDALRGLTLTLKNLHVRYEDDYFAGESPYSFGLVIDELRFGDSGGTTT